MKCEEMSGNEAWKVNGVRWRLRDNYTSSGVCLCFNKVLHKCMLHHSRPELRQLKYNDDPKRIRGGRYSLCVTLELVFKVIFTIHN